MPFLQDPIGLIGQWLSGLLTGWGLSAALSNGLLNTVGIVALITAAMILDIFLVWVERKVVARFQDRLGPNRVGPFGLFQPFADIIKLILKEDTTPAGANKWLYNLSPILSMASVLLLWAILPIASFLYGVNLNVAMLFILAAGAIGTLSIIMAGWASNNKFALLGAYRMVANLISYEIPMVIALLIPVMLAGSMSVVTITREQGAYWYVLVAPLGALLFLVAAIAELGRSPFDLNEGESEIVAGFHIEYSGMKFGLFYAGELLHAFTFGAFISVLFFGGWHGPWSEQYPVLGLLYFFVKAMFFYWVIMWIKYTVPRIRIDHMLYFNWKFLTPLGLAVLMVLALVHKTLPRDNQAVYVAGMLAANLILGWITVEILRGQTRRQRAMQEQPPAASTAQALANPAED
jgi:NADH-quinone oxidoreductase subunit H